VGFLVIVAVALPASGTRANPPRWSIKVGAPRSFTPLGPGAAETLPFRATAGSRADGTMPRFAASIPQEPNGDAESVAAADIPGCLARWFTATVAQVVARAGAYEGTIAVTMLNGATNQDACRGESPAVTITAAG
jgi:hypothetical protein